MDISRSIAFQAPIGHREAHRELLPVGLSTLYEGHKFVFARLLLVSGCGGRLLCLARANGRYSFLLGHARISAMTSVASVQHNHVCSREIGTPPQGTSAAVFWFDVFSCCVRCGVALNMQTCSVIRFSFID